MYNWMVSHQHYYNTCIISILMAAFLFWWKYGGCFPGWWESHPAPVLLAVPRVCISLFWSASLSPTSERATESLKWVSVVILSSELLIILVSFGQDRISVIIIIRSVHNNISSLKLHHTQQPSVLIALISCADIDSNYHLNNNKNPNLFLLSIISE